MMIFFSMAAGGGVRGRGNGIARGSMIQAGATMGNSLFSSKRTVRLEE